MISDKSTSLTGLYGPKELYMNHPKDTSFFGWLDFQGSPTET